MAILGQGKPCQIGGKMKVREMLEMWCADGGTNETLNGICLDFVKEFNRLAKVRNAKSNRAFVAIWKELQTKWDSLCEQINKHPKREHMNGLQKSGFQVMMNAIMPGVTAAIVSVLLSEELDKGRRDWEGF